MTTTALTAPAAAAAIPKASFDWKPEALVLSLILAGWPLVGSTSTWRDGGFFWPL